jgi:hypothetical protein
VLEQKAASRRLILLRKDSHWRKQSAQE